MQKYAKIDNSIVDNISFSPKVGYIKVPNNVFGDMIQQEDGTFLSPPVIISPEEEIKIKIQSNKDYLESTDFKMTVDYFDTMTTERQLEIVSLRATARAYVKANED